MITPEDLARLERLVGDTGLEALLGYVAGRYWEYSLHNRLRDSDGVQARVWVDAWDDEPDAATPVQFVYEGYGDNGRPDGPRLALAEALLRAIDDYERAQAAARERRRRLEDVGQTSSDRRGPPDA